MRGPGRPRRRNPGHPVPRTSLRTRPLQTEARVLSVASPPADLVAAGRGGAVLAELIEQQEHGGVAVLDQITPLVQAAR